MDNEKWEYITMALEATGFWSGGGKLDLELLNSRLNELGRQGWELVSTFDTNKEYGKTRDVVAILKRKRT